MDYEESRFDIVAGLLSHNMIEQAEFIFDLVGLKQAWICRQVRYYTCVLKKRLYKPRVHELCFLLILPLRYVLQLP